MQMVCLKKAVQPTRRKSREANKDDAEADNLWSGLEVIKSI